MENTIHGKTEKIAHIGVKQLRKTMRCIELIVQALSKIMHVLSQLEKSPLIGNDYNVVTTGDYTFTSA